MEPLFITFLYIVYRGSFFVSKQCVTAFSIFSRVLFCNAHDIPFEMLLRNLYVTVYVIKMLMNINFGLSLNMHFDLYEYVFLCSLCKIVDSFVLPSNIICFIFLM